MKKTLIVLMTVLLSAMLVISCDGNAGESKNEGSSNVPTYTVTFDSKGGSDVAKAEVEKGKKVTKPDNPTKESYIFDKWTTDEAGKYEYTFNIAPEGDITLYAQWTINQYDVSFNSDGGSPASYETKKVDYDNTISTSPGTPTKAGFAFDGWYNGNTKFEFGTTKVRENIELKAKWKTTYTVTFNVEDDTTTIQAQTITEGSTASKPTNPTKDGWIFDHWAKEKNGTTAFDFTTSINENTTLYAVFRNYYKVGDTGPAGGWIVYDVDADNTTEDEDGADNLKSSTLGWRYLEASKSRLTLEGTDKFIFGYKGTIEHEERRGQDSAVLTSDNTAIGKGKTNTDALVNAMGSSAYVLSQEDADRLTKDEGEETSSTATATTTTANYAAKLCSDYSVSYNGQTYDDWFLPSKDELNAVGEAKSVISGSDYLNCYGYGGVPDYLTSSEVDKNTVHSQSLYYYGGTSQSTSKRGEERSVLPVRYVADN